MNGKKKKTSISIVEKKAVLAAVFVLGFFSSCVSLKTPKRADLVPLQAPMTMGKYPVNVSRTIETGSYKGKIISTVVWYYFKNSKDIDSLEIAQATHIELKLSDKKHLTAILYKGNAPLKTGVLKGHLKKGYFRARHDLSLRGVPPFFWSVSSAKMQFGIGKKGQLYIDSANETNGSILIMVAGTPGFTQSLTIPVYEK
ncbi:hypothetical protein [Pedobacter steynii]|nr:hypothetical protein [Pedobacter steynii]